MGQTLKVEILGDARSYQNALNKASGATTSFGSSLLKLGKYAALGLGAAGVGGAIVVLKRGFDEFGESAKVAAQTGAVLKSTGAAANVTAKNVETLATSLSRMSGADDEAIQAGENMLLTFTNIRNETGKGNDIFNQATKATLDMATAMNQGATPSAEALAKQSILVGKALNDPIKGMSALRRVGVSFTEAQQKQIEALVKSGHTMEAQKLILRELGKEFGGSAKAAGETFPGQLNKLKNSFDELAGRIVGKLVPSLERLIEWISGHMPQIEAAVDAAMKGAGQAIQWLEGQVRTHWGTITQIFQSSIAEIVSVGKQLVSFFQTDIGKSVAVTAIAMVGFVKAFGAATAAIKVFRAAAILLGGTPQLIAIGALLTGLTYLGLKLGLIKNPFSIAASATEKLIDKFNEVAHAAQTAGDAFNVLAHSDLDLASAKLRVVESSHAVEAALKAQKAASDGTTKVTLAEKEAADQVARAKLDYKEATLGVADAEKSSKDAHDAVTKSLQSQLPTLLGVLQRTQAAGEAADKAAGGMRSFTLAGDDSGKVYGRTSEAVKTAGKALLETGEQAYKASFAMKGASPAAQLAQRSMATLQIAAGTLAASLGRVPTKKEIIAQAKLEGGPVFIAGLKAFVSEAQKAGVKVPQWIRSAIGPTRTASAAVAAAAKGPLVGLPAAGFAAGSGMGAGVARGILAQIAPALAAGVALVDQTILAMRNAADAKSPSKKTADLGKDLTKGLLAGLTSLGPELTKALVDAITKGIDKTKTAAVKGMGNASGAIVAAAKKAGVDARAALAVAMTEGGTSFGAKGDKDTSFGPFQLHIGGALAAGMDPAKAAAFANSLKGITFAIEAMAKAGAAGKTGLDAITAIVKNFERPLDAAGQIKKAFEFYKNIPAAAVAAIASGSAAITAEQIKQLQAINEIVKTGAKTIGLTHAREVIAGMFEGSPGIVAQARKAMADAVAAAKQAVVDAKEGFKTAFSTMATEALAAFDAVTAAWHPPILDVVAGLRAEDAADALQKSVDTAAQAVKDARAKLVADQAAGPQPGELPEDYQKRIDEDNAAIDRAVLEQGAATRAQLEANMELQGAEEQRQWEERRGKIRAALEADLVVIYEELNKQPEAYAKTQRKIIKTMAKYHLPMKTAGKTLASKFAEGLDEGIAEVIKTARKLANALEAIPGVTKPPGGNDGTDNTDERGRPPDVGSNQRGTSAMNVTVNMPNYLGDKREAARAIRDEIVRSNRDNAYNPLAI